jgi:hypothetical protein
MGWIAYHVPSRCYAQYPGGPFQGRAKFGEEPAGPKSEQ